MTKMCFCGERPAAECEEEWGPKCDLGNNPMYMGQFIEEDFDDFYDAYEFEPWGYVLAGAGAAILVGLLGLATWLAFR